MLRALGGFGKSALTWHWLLHEVDPGHWSRVVWFSFYETESTFENFLIVTLAYLGHDPSQLRGPRQMARLFSDHRQAIEVAQKISDACTFSLDELVYRYPSEFLPEGYTTAAWLKEFF